MCISNIPVTMVRIMWPDKKIPVNHGDNVTVAMLKDAETDIVYLRIVVNQKVLSRVHKVH